MKLSITTDKSILLHTTSTVGVMVAIGLDGNEEIIIVCPDWIYELRVFQNGASECRKRKKG